MKEEKKCKCRKVKMIATEFGLEMKTIKCKPHFIEKYGKEYLPLQSN